MLSDRILIIHDDPARGRWVGYSGTGVLKDGVTNTEAERYILRRLREISSLKDEVEAEPPTTPNGLVSDFGYHAPRSPGFQAAEYEQRLERERQEKLRASATRRQAKLRGKSGVVFTRQMVIERDQSICHLCGKLCRQDEIHLDHVIPLAKGGEHTAENVRVSCSSCNLSKGSRLLNQ